MSQEPIKNRYDFVLLFDVKDGNPNGDPDAGNSARIDTETGEGLVSDVALKRKVRNFVHLAKTDMDTDEPAAGYDIYVKHRGILENEQQKAYDAEGLKSDEKSKGKSAANVDKARDWMCQTFYDVRTFGAVMSTKQANCGQVRGPVQLTFARSMDPINPLEQSITRKAVATQREAKTQIDKHGMVTGTMGRKEIVPYGLYRAHGFISPHLARTTKFSEADLELFWQALQMMFEHDRSATRGEMATRKLVVFEHESPLGNAPAHRLFERVEASLVDESRPPRRYADYAVTVDGDELPSGVTLHTFL
ncbi:MAG: type I-C CRISPR-associated protein Cas7/Csd2 [Acidobacteriota bacterium]